MCLNFQQRVNRKPVFRETFPIFELKTFMFALGGLRLKPDKPSSDKQRRSGAGSAPATIRQTELQILMTRS